MPTPDDRNAGLVLKETLELVRRLLNTKRAGDLKLAVYVMRDLEATKQVGLDDLAWAMDREGNCSHSEVVWLVDEVERRWQEKEEP